MCAKVVTFLYNQGRKVYRNFVFFMERPSRRQVLDAMTLQLEIGQKLVATERTPKQSPKIVTEAIKAHDLITHLLNFPT